MSALTTPLQINTFRLATLRRGIKMEAFGMKLTRGRSCLSIAKSELGLGRNARREDVLAALDAKIAEAHAEMGIA